MVIMLGPLILVTNPRSIMHRREVERMRTLRLLIGFSLSVCIHGVDIRSK